MWHLSWLKLKLKTFPLFLSMHLYLWLTEHIMQIQTWHKFCRDTGTVILSFGGGIVPEISGSVWGCSSLLPTCFSASPNFRCSSEVLLPKSDLLEGGGVRSGTAECAYSKLAAPSNYAGFKGVSQGVIHTPKPARPSLPTTFNFCRRKRHISCSAINLSDYRVQAVWAAFWWGALGMGWEVDL